MEVVNKKDGNKNFMIIKGIEIDENDYKFKMLKNNKVNEVAFAPIQGEDEIVGLVIVSSVGENRLWDKYLENELNKFASKISILFAFEKKGNENEGSK